MKKIIIVGSGGLANEVFFETLKEKYNYIIDGFVSRATSGSIRNLNFLGDDSYLLRTKKKYNLLICVGDINLREKLYKKLKKNKNLLFPNFYPKNFHYLKFQGEGNIVFSSCEISTNVLIGSLNLFGQKVFIGHDVKVKNINNFSPSTVINGNVKIGSKCFFGSNSNVNPSLLIKNKTILGSGSNLITNTLSNNTYFGNPARILFKK
jgi:acetyltransferase-like isoleucine patch superfamily enzyme